MQYLSYQEQKWSWLLTFVTVAIVTFCHPITTDARTISPEAAAYSFFTPAGYTVEPWYAGDGVTLNGHVITSEEYGLRKWELSTQLIVLHSDDISQQFAESQVQLICAADGVDSSISCPDSISVRPIKNNYGIRGFRMILKEEHVHNPDGKIMFTRLRGPVALVQLNPTLGVLISYNGESPSGKNRVLFNTILRTIRLTHP